VVAESKLMGWSNSWLARTYARLARPPAPPGQPPAIRLVAEGPRDR